jgi:hypothetical protein
MFKIANKTDSTIKYAKIVFNPRESKVLDLVNPIPHENFIIEKIEETEKPERTAKEHKLKLKGGLK